MRKISRIILGSFIVGAVALSGPVGAAAQQSGTAPSVEQRVAETVKVLPKDLRDGATVVSYDSSTGARTVLREGTNFIECQTRMADGFVRCYSQTLRPRRDLEAKLRAQKKSDKEIQEGIAAAVKDGSLPASSKGMMSYRAYDKRDRIQDLWVIALPNATPEKVGVSTTSQRDAALEGKGLPWMMLPGTPGAHIMIPINPPVKTTTITDQASDEVTQATLPLPEDLRANAAVFKYDPKTGERISLKAGTGVIECLPRGDDSFTWCYNKSTAKRRDFQEKLRAQGKSQKEIQEATEAAVKAGTLEPTPFGTMSYRLYGKKDRIQLLWVLSVPGATPESIGVSTGSQREAAIGGDGRPWLMLPGTPGAHIMIPINK